MKRILTLLIIGLSLWTTISSPALGITPFAPELDPNLNETTEVQQDTGADKNTNQNTQTNNTNQSKNTNNANQSAPNSPARDLTQIVLPSEDSIFGGENNGINLPSGDALTEVVPAIVTNFFYVIGFLIFVALIYAGFLLVIGRGNEENTEKAKQILTSGALALALVVLGYAIVYGISTIQFENDPQSQIDDIYTDGQLPQK